MVVTVMVKHWLLALALIYVTIFNLQLGKAEEEFPEAGGASADPAQIVAEALLCFTDKYIYNSCEETYRLTERGTLNVPPEYTDEYCSGPCQAETHLLLNCIGNIFHHFEFYNKATIEDVRDTIKAGCGYDGHRGNFNVAEHLKAEENKADSITIPVFFVLILMILGYKLFI